MKLRTDISLVEFLRQAGDCRDNVYFETPEGDRLNIKSQLSKFVFLAAVSAEEDVIRNGEIVFDDEQDQEILRLYLA